MKQGARVVVLQTAFPGDVVLALPMVQALRKKTPDAYIGFVATPVGSELLKNHPDISVVLTYDKRGKDRGVAGARRFASRLREENFDTALVPHRSIRTALVTRIAGIPRRVGFSTSAGRLFFTDVVPYDGNAHEIERDLSLVGAVGFLPGGRFLPSLYPASGDVSRVDTLVHSWYARGGVPGRLVALAPGSVWATKRWPVAHFIGLARLLVEAGWGLALVGGKEDLTLCNQIAGAVGFEHALNAAGSLSLLESAELVRRCDVLVTNDSAPMHLAGAMRVPVVALFGPTVPAFGFAPSGPGDIVIERQGLSCRPCSIHGGTRCPVGTFECMIAVSPGEVFRAVESLLVPSILR
jgi:heptosyltransferase-2